MMWRRITLSAGSIVLAALLWVYSPVALDWMWRCDGATTDSVCGGLLRLFSYPAGAMMIRHNRKSAGGCLLSRDGRC
jgi:hypothetical protein